MTMDENIIIENEESTDLVPAEDFEVVEDNFFGKGMLIGVVGVAALYGIAKGGKKAFTWAKGKYADMRAKKSGKGEPIEVDYSDSEAESEEEE